MMVEFRRSIPAGGQLFSSELSEQSGLQSHNLSLLIHVLSEQVYSKSVQILGSVEKTLSFCKKKYVFLVVNEIIETYCISLEIRYLGNPIHLCHQGNHVFHHIGHIHNHQTRIGIDLACKSLQIV